MKASHRGATQNLAQTRKGKKLLARKKDCWQGKKTAGKDFRERALTPVATKKCVNVRGKRHQFYKKHNNFRKYVLK